MARRFRSFYALKSVLDGALTEVCRPAYWAHHARVWLERPNLLPISYAALETDYETTVRTLWLNSWA